jgi:hypothetical protein
MVHQGVERKVKDPLTRRLLFHEMTFNVVNSIYPCSLEEASKLAAIHLMIRCGLSATKEDVAFVPRCYELGRHATQTHRRVQGASAPQVTDEHKEME